MATTSPIEAASGVARLSGFILYFLDKIITATNTKSVEIGRKKTFQIEKSKSKQMHPPRTKLADVAVNMPEAITSIA